MNSFDMKRVVGIMLILFGCKDLFPQTLDQSQLIYNGGMSARHLTGYSEWQSYSAGMTGDLCQIKMGFFNYINGSGTLKIFSGLGTNGPLLQSQSVSVNCPSGNCMITFNVAVTQTAGQVYTFQFIPGTGIPDPYGVQVQVPGTYAGGQLDIVDPSGTYNTGFDLVFQTYVCTVLPIELVSFDVQLNAHQQAEITWSTASEFNNDFFTIEKSTGGENFHPVEIIKGAGNSVTPNYYQWVDDQPAPGMNYYRLKQTDFDGTSTYSNIVPVKCDFPGLTVASYCDAAPPVLVVNIQSSTVATATLELLDVAGRIVFHASVSANSETKISTSGFPKGIYLLKVIAGSKSLIRKTWIN